MEFLELVEIIKTGGFKARDFNELFILNINKIRSFLGHQGIQECDILLCYPKNMYKKGEGSSVCLFFDKIIIEGKTHKTTENIEFEIRLYEISNIKGICLKEKPDSQIQSIEPDSNLKLELIFENSKIVFSNTEDANQHWQEDYGEDIFKIIQHINQIK